MVLWWIGNAILLVVILPVVIFLLNRVLAALERIRGATDDILAGGAALVSELDGVRAPRDGRGHTPTTRARKWPTARSATRARSRSFSADRKGETAMPAAAWVTLIIAALIIAITAVGL